MKKWRNKILSAVLVLSLLLTSSSFAFAVGEEGTTEEPVQEVKITRDEIASLTPSSQESVEANSTIDNAFDGDKTGNSDDTIWHTSWTDENDTSEATGFPRSVKIELNEAQWISKMIYYPRNGNGTNGRFRVCKVYVSEDGKNWGEPIITSSIWENNTSSNTLELTSPKYTKYILIYGDETYGNSGNTAVNDYASAAEIELYKDMSKYPTITKQPVSTISSSPVTLSVEATASDGTSGLTYQWYSYTDNISNATAVSEETDASITVTPTETMTYYFVKVTQTVDGYTTSVNSNPAYVKSPDASSELTQINTDNGLSIIDYSSESGSNNNHNKAIDKIKRYDGWDFWETDYNGNDTKLYMTFDLGRVYSLAEVNYYYGRSEGGGNGVPKNLEIWTSIDNVNWTLSKVGEIPRTLKPNTTNKYYYDVRIKLDSPISAQYVKLHPQNNKVYEGNSFAIGEAEFFVDLSSETLITQQPVIEENENNKIIKLETAEGSSVQWYSNDIASVEGAQSISGATSKTYNITDTDNSKYYFAKVTKGDKTENSIIVFVGGKEVKIGENIGTFDEMISQAQNGDTIVLLKDISINKEYDISGKNITIKSADNNSYTLNRGKLFSNSMFNVGANGMLTLENIVLDGGAIWDDNGDNTGIVGEPLICIDNDHATVNINNGAVLKNNQNTVSGIYEQEIVVTCGGAIRLNAGTLNLNGGEISGNSSKRGNGIYYGGSGNVTAILNINNKINLLDDIYLSGNGGKVPKITSDITGNSPINITVGSERSNENIAESDNSNIDNLKKSMNVFRVYSKYKNPNSFVSTYFNNNNNLQTKYLSFDGDANAIEIQKDLTSSTYYRGIENNLYTVTGSGSITYIWYEKAPESNEFTVVGENLDSLSDGTHTVYCVATDGTNYMVSDVAEVTVADFVPCSKAIDKFKNI